MEKKKSMKNRICLAGSILHKLINCTRGLAGQSKMVDYPGQQTETLLNEAITSSRHPVDMKSADKKHSYRACGFQKNPFLYSEHVLLSGSRTLLSISWERQNPHTNNDLSGKGEEKGCREVEGGIVIAQRLRIHQRKEQQERERGQEGRPAEQRQLITAEATGEEAKAKTWSSFREQRTGKGEKVLVGKLEVYPRGERVLCKDVFIHVILTRQNFLTSQNNRKYS